MCLHSDCCFPIKVVLLCEMKASLEKTSLSVLVLLDVLSICLGIHELVDILGILDKDLENPAVILGLSIDNGGVALDVLVVLKDLAGHRGVDIGGSLHRLDTADAVSLGKAGANLGDLQVHDVTKLTLSEVSNADLCLL
jgi:hypothetical protein